MYILNCEQVNGITIINVVACCKEIPVNEPCEDGAYQTTIGPLFFGDDTTCTDAATMMDENGCGQRCYRVCTIIRFIFALIWSAEIDNSKQKLHFPNVTLII